MNLYYSEKWKGNKLLIFSVMCFVLTFIMTIIGIFLYPLLAWIMNSAEAMFTIGIILMFISFIFFVISIVMSIRHARKQPKENRPKNVFYNPIVIISLFLFVLFFSNFMVFGQKSEGDFSRDRWGKCLVGENVYSMFGIKKIKMNGGKIYKVYLSEGEKGFLALSNIHTEETDRGSSYRYYKFSFTAKIYNSKGNFLKSHDFNDDIYFNRDKYRYEWNDNFYGEYHYQELARDMAIKEFECSKEN